VSKSGVIAATNRDLPRAIAEGRFRDDLYYRLGVFPILLPPLRERREDIPLLIWKTIERLQARLGRHVTRVPKPVMARLVSYAWPGNVRELENVIERALILSPGPVLQVEETVDAAGSRRADRLDEVERDHILHVLTRCEWRVNGDGNTAEVLGLNPSTLRSRMKKLGITRPTRRARTPR
jgi:formate hydrogenlyase transcriptional activator